MNSDADIAAYWQRVYSKAAGAGIPLIPSQFAVFVAGEMAQPGLVVEIGCGNGRDAMFLGQYGHQVIGFDASQAAIALCMDRASNVSSNILFECAEISGPRVLEVLQTELARQSTKEIMVYSRFFLHAVPESDQTALLALARVLGALAPTRLAVEFRTVSDADLPKAAAQHYRRFIDPVELLEEAKEMGFKTDYFVEGVGYAKYGSEDAHVARGIFSI